MKNDSMVEVILGNATGRPELSLLVTIYNATKEYSKLLRYTWTYYNKPYGTRTPFKVP
jgi:hypothetical protein